MMPAEQQCALHTLNDKLIQGDTERYISTTLVYWQSGSSIVRSVAGLCDQDIQGQRAPAPTARPWMSRIVRISTKIGVFSTKPQTCWKYKQTYRLIK